LNFVRVTRPTVSNSPSDQLVCAVFGTRCGLEDDSVYPIWSDIVFEELHSCNVSLAPGGWVRGGPNIQVIHDPAEQILDLTISYADSGPRIVDKLVE